MFGLTTPHHPSQLFAFCVVLHTLVTAPDPGATHAAFAWSDSPVKAAVAVLNVFFAYGGQVRGHVCVEREREGGRESERRFGEVATCGCGVAPLPHPPPPLLHPQFAFTEIVVAMARPHRFAPAACVVTIIMTLAYTLLGVVGYASRGRHVHGVVVFSLGAGAWERAAAAAVLVQACAQYLVNLNVGCHNVLTLWHRRRVRSAAAASAGRGAADDDAGPGPRVAADHGPAPWAVVTAGVVAYSYAISATLPYFSTLSGIMTATSYLVTSFVAPCAFALKLLPLSPVERAWCRFLIVAMSAASLAGLGLSVTALVQNIGGGPA